MTLNRERRIKNKNCKRQTLARRDQELTMETTWGNMMWGQRGEEFGETWSRESTGKTESGGFGQKRNVNDKRQGANHE